MISLISVKGLDHAELSSLMENNNLPSISEYMELHKVIASPPFVYPYSVWPMLTGMFQLNLEFKKQKNLCNFESCYSHKTNSFDILKSMIIREPIYADRHTWIRAEKALRHKKPDLFRLTLQTPELFRKLKKRSTLEQRSSGYVHLDYIVHRLYNIIGGHSANLIVIAGAGKDIKKDKLLFIKKLLKKKVLKKPIKCFPGITLLNVPEDKDLRTELLDNIVKADKADFIAYKNETGFTVEFLNGKTTVNTGKNQNILELEHTGQSPLSGLPKRLIRRELLFYTGETEYPMLLCHIEKIFRHSSFNTVISKDVFKKENLIQPVLINRKWRNIYQSTDVFYEIMKEAGHTKYLTHTPELDTTLNTQSLAEPQLRYGIYA